MRSEGSTLGFKVHGKNPRLGLVIEKLSKNLQLGFWDIHVYWKNPQLGFGTYMGRTFNWDLGLIWEEPSIGIWDLYGKNWIEPDLGLIWEELDRTGFGEELDLGLIWEELDRTGFGTYMGRTG